MNWHVHNGTNRSPLVRIHARGVYTWQVTTHGNRTNRSDTHPCAQAAETTVIAKPNYPPPVVNGGFAGTLTKPDLVRRGASTHIHMPAIDLDAPVLAEGIRAGRMTLPPNVHRAGWLRKSAGVADKIGTTVIAGHVSDRHDNPGAMFHLSRAHHGQHITIRKNGKSYRFTVVATATFDRDRRLPHRYFTTNGPHSLVLISCTHRVVYPNGHFHYTRYQIVVAHPIQPRGRAQ